MATIGAPSMPTGVNLALDPSMESGIANAQAITTGALSTMTFDSTVTRRGTGQSILLTRTTSTLNSTIAGLNATSGQQNNAARLTVTPGVVYSGSIWVRTDQANWQGRLNYLWKDNTGANLGGGAVLGPLISGQPANTWVLLKQENATAPANAAQLTMQPIISTGTGNVVGGEKGWFDDVMFVQGATVPAYADGSFSGWRWTNGANRSISVQGLRSIAQLNRCFDPGMEMNALGWSALQGSSNPTLHPGAFDLTTKRSGTRSWSETRAVSTPNNTVGALYYTPVATANNVPLSIFCTPGEIVSTGVWMMCSVAWNSRISILFRDAAGNAISQLNGPTVFNQPTSTWVWCVYENVVVPAGSVMMFCLGTAFGANAYNTVGGEKTWYDDCVVNSGPRAHGSWSPAEQPPGGGAIWLSSVPNYAAIRPIGPWSQWDGVTEDILGYTGVWDGSTVQTKTLASVSTV